MKKLVFSLFIYCILSSAIAQNPNYLIICPDSLHHCADKLMGYRENTGYNVIIEDLSNITKGNQVSNEIIDSWIEDYITVNQDLEYIVLLGSIDNIPTYFSYSDGIGNFDSDLWYSVTNDSLNTDYLPTLSVGRIPISNTQEFTNYFNKIKNFEYNLTKSSKTILFYGYEAEMGFAINRDIPIAEANGFKTISLILPDKATLFNTLNSEHLYAVIYYGHGSWLGDYKLNQGNLTDWENIDRPVLYFSGACSFNDNTNGIIPFGDVLAINPNGSVSSIGCSINGGYGDDYLFIEGILSNITNCSSIGNLYNTALNFQFDNSPDYGEGINISPDNGIGSWAYYFTRRMNFIGDPGLLINSTTNNIPINGNKSLSIEAFPNPTNGKLYLQNISQDEKLEVKIYNSLGVLYKRIQYLKSNKVIDISSFQSGVYILVFNTPEIKPIKIIKTQ